MKIKIPSSSPTPPPPPSSIGNYPVTVEYLNSVWGEVSAYGTKMMPDGRIWVIHGLTGQPIERHQVRPVNQDGKGNVIYVRPHETIRPGLDTVHPSVWKNPTKFSL